MPPPTTETEVVRFGQLVAETLAGRLGDRLLGVWFVGSVALGGYVAGESDVDVAAVLHDRLPAEEKPRLAAGLLDVTPRCPARGLELTLYRAAVAAAPPAGADFELNVNGGPRMARDVHLSSASEPAFWYVLDRAIAHRAGVTISGPPAHEVFADAPRPQLLELMADSMRWHRAHERATLYSVLNASRAWRFAVEDVLGSKLEGASFARARWAEPGLVDAAVELRHGREGQLDAAEVDRFLRHVEDELGRAR